MLAHDFVAIGAGPANLSLAALAHGVSGAQGVFVERQERFAWHPGMMLPGSELQVSFLKDLVSLVDPTNHFSFLNFLMESGRLYRFAALVDSAITRQEFAQYYRWVSDQLPEVQFGTEVLGVSLTPTEDAFVVKTSRGPCETRRIVLGVGRPPRIPEWAAGQADPDIVHSSALLTRRPQLDGRRVAIIGGGQSGAEIVDYALSGRCGQPASLTWVTSRSGLYPLDDSAFTNDFFSPRYVEYFRGLDSTARADLLREQLLASDGITPSLLTRLYRRFYENDYLRADGPTIRLLAANRAVALDHVGATKRVAVRDTKTGSVESIDVDLVVLCTGYDHSIPSVLRDLDGSWGAEPELDDCYRLQWDGPEGLVIYGQNLGTTSHGVADRNLSLNAWRSAVILNDISASAVYDTRRGDLVQTWVAG